MGVGNARRRCGRIRDLPLGRGPASWRGFGEGSRENALTHRSILYWAKQSAKAEYERVRSQTIDFFIEQIFNYPTYAEGYRVAALNGFNKIKHRK